MTRPRPRAGITFLAMALGVLLAPGGGCASDKLTIGFLPEAGTSAETTDGGSFWVDGSFGASDGGASPGCNTCSTDLHQVLDCSQPPKVITTCPDDQACGANGKCVTPCESAALNQSSIGCNYYAVPLHVYDSPLADAHNDPEHQGGINSIDGSCFAAFVANTWNTPMKVTLDWKGTQIDATPFTYSLVWGSTALTYKPIPPTGIPANNIAIVFLSELKRTVTPGFFNPQILCPSTVKAAITTEDVALHGTGIGHAIGIRTSVPASVYDVYPYGGAASFVSSASLLLPTEVWATNYVAVSAWSGQILHPDTGPDWKSPMNIDLVASEDNTQITIFPSADIEGSPPAVASATKSQPVTYTLNKGETLGLSQFADLSGSPIQSNKPVGLWGGHWCMWIPDVQNIACDGAHQQIPPVAALGSEYLAVRYRTRRADGTEEKVPWRIMGTVTGTQLTYDPPQPGAPATLDLGTLVEYEATGPFHVKSQDSQHPFYMAAHMTGGAAIGDKVNPYPEGDPETVNLMPPKQFLKSYIFITDPTYGYTNLVFVRGKGADGAYHDVKLDCIEDPLTGWEPIGSSGYQLTRVDVQLEGRSVGLCNNGKHTASSDEPFGITVWGWDSWVSYAYPAGASVKPINSVVVPPVPK
jgi:hypothetical protein